MIQPNRFTKILLFIPLFFILILLSCKTQKTIKIPNATIETAYHKSLQEWQQLKKRYENSYEYAISYSSWVGYSSTTTIVVKKGKVIERSYAETQQNLAGQFSQKEILLYKEVGADLNTHEKGYRAVKLDQIYEDCGTISLQADEFENSLYFTIDDDGVLQSCGSTRKNCVDDCSSGVYISGFEWLE